MLKKELRKQYTNDTESTFPSEKDICDDWLEYIYYLEGRIILEDELYKDQFDDDKMYLYPSEELKALFNSTSKCESNYQLNLRRHNNDILRKIQRRNR